MTVSEILASYSKSSLLAELCQKIKEKGVKNLQIKGLNGSANTIVNAALFQNLQQPFLVILNDKEEAAYFLNDLETILGDDKVLFFPTSYKKAYQIEDTNNANIQLRAEALTKIASETKPLIVVSYPEALNEKVVTKSHLQSNTFKISKGEKISLDFLIDFLHEYDFENVDFVIEPGQFSVRGGIIDVFSFSNEYPYRIEFFGDEVDSIRSFNVADQLSLKNLVKATIIPNVQNKLLIESRTSFLKFLPENAIIWLKDFAFAKSRIEKEYQLAEQSYSKLNETIRQLPPNELYIQADEFVDLMNVFQKIEFGTQLYFSPDFVQSFNTSPQPVFNKNFNLLTENLNTNTKLGFKNIILCDNAKQQERLLAIFQDIGSKSIFNTSVCTLHEGFVDKNLNLAVYCDHQIFERYHKFKLKGNKISGSDPISLKELYGLQPGDFVTHIDFGIGRFSGLEKIEVNGKLQEAIRLVYKNDDILYVSIHSLHKIAKYVGKEGTAPSVNKLGTNTWENLKNKTKKKVKEIAFDLIKLYAKRKAAKGFAFSPDNYLQNELEASFIYEDTPDQEKATTDVKRDMESRSPMDRLVCGDVGFGKTEVAIRAAFKAVCDSKQVAVLVPTTILALQHYKTFKERLKDLPCRVDYINRFKSAKDQKKTLEDLANGKVDIIIGTHRLVGKDVKFKDIGLLIIDEEQKFGVGVKEKLKLFKENVDSLTLTATPIPRTLQFSLMGARDLSVIATPPPNRQPVQTEIHTFNEELIRDVVAYEISRNGQVFFINNRVANLPEIAGLIQRLVPDSRVCYAHGQMEGDKMEEVMLDFVEGNYDVLVATTIIESGLDISNANTIFINNAHNFGLSDLHQMRGRVGRSNKKAFCYLLAPPLSTVSSDARRRLAAIEQFSDIGSGFHISMRDLDIRGAGDLLGGEQSGFINEIGYDMYQKILDEAIRELKEEKYAELMAEGGDDYEALQSLDNASKFIASDCQVDTDLEILIPSHYVTSSQERLTLYKDLDNIDREVDLMKFRAGLEDRFGKVPSEVDELIDTVRLRWIARELGFEKLMLKGGKMTGYFIGKQTSPFYQSKTFSKVLHYIQVNHKYCKMREANEKLSLTFNDVQSISRALFFLKQMEEFE